MAAASRMRTDPEQFIKDWNDTEKYTSIDKLAVAYNVSKRAIQNFVSELRAKEHSLIDRNIISGKRPLDIASDGVPAEQLTIIKQQETIKNQNSRITELRG